jgi:regulator of cell morphogenesis and NO signaling
MSAQHIDEHMKMADVIHLNHLLLFVLERFNISLGFGDKSVETVCLDNNIQPDFFVKMVNSFLDPSYIPEAAPQHFPTKQAISYLKNAHNYYVHDKIPEIESLIKGMESQCELKSKNMEILNQFFQKYRKEVEEHIQKEEEVTFPYILEIAEAYNQKVLSPELQKKMKNYSIHIYAKEHDNIEEKLYDLKNIIIKYLPPVSDQNLCRKILIELFNLEKDLNDHGLLEDRVIVPLIAEMESELKKFPLQTI